GCRPAGVALMSWDHHQGPSASWAMARMVRWAWPEALGLVWATVQVMRVASPEAGRQPRAVDEHVSHWAAWGAGKGPQVRQWRSRNWPGAVPSRNSAVAASRVTGQPSVARTRVEWWSRTPPLPETRTRSWSGTWRWPAWPRAWMTASDSGVMPHR